jgi:hypothetical protein
VNSVDPTDARKHSMFGKEVAVENAVAGVPRAGKFLRDAGIGEITRQPYPASWRTEMDRIQLDVR